jgi:hypothetical protein
MDIEQLNEIMTLLGNLGSGGYDAFIWWLLASEVLPFIFGIVVLFAIYRLGVKIVESQDSDRRNEEALIRIGAWVGEHAYHPLIAPERERIENRVKELVQAKQDSD